MERGMRGEDAAAGDRGDMCHLGQNAGIAQKPEQSQMIQGRSQAAAGECQTDFFHGIPCAAVRSDSQSSRNGFLLLNHL
jgi:hypothetical protein